MDNDKNQLLMNVLKERLMKRRMKEAQEHMGEEKMPDSQYGMHSVQADEPSMRVPADDMDNDFYNLVKHFSKQNEMEQEQQEPVPDRERARYEELVNLFNKGTKR